MLARAALLGVSDGQGRHCFLGLPAKEGALKEDGLKEGIAGNYAGLEWRETAISRQFRRIPKHEATLEWKAEAFNPNTRKQTLRCPESDARGYLIRLFLPHHDRDL